MAPPNNAPKPGRTLLALFAVMAVLAGLAVWQGQKTPKLGLDLAGGTTVTLTAKTSNGKNPPAEQMDQAVKIMTQRVNGLGVSDAEVTKQGSNNIVVNVPGEGQGRVVNLIGTTAKLQFRQVFAVADGRPSAGGAPSPSASPSTKGQGGKDEGKSPSPSASASPSGSPSSTPRGRALSGALTAPTPSPSGTGTPSPSPSASSPLGQPSGQPAPPAQDYPGVTDKAVIKQFEALDCYGGDRRAPGANDPNRKFVAACDQDEESDQVAKYILGPVRVLGENVDEAAAMPPDASQGQASWSVSLKFDGKGARQFGAVTTDASAAYQQDPSSPRAQVAIILDGQVVSAPSIREGPITGGTASIDGPPDSFDQQYATDLANVLKYGALPLEFTQSSIDEVSSTLGSDQLTGGLIAGAIGLGLVVLYCMFYYRGLGLVAVSSLVVASAVTYLSVVILGEGMGFRLSLPHIIGLIVSIGITADSFIVYFERLRDELRAGRKLRSSVENAWKRARRTILVADAVTFLAALVLYFLAVGGVAGFAFAMGLTTLIDVVVVFFFTKPLVALLSRTKFFGRGHPLSGLDPTRLHKAGQGTPAATARKTSQEA
ncbi:protein translocase subunit SecD [Actinomadura madurae]|uniref:Protein translocase subunit SecD n=1 Tax=Actinomadura madurae TaxID=1993 RepID=A0A1I5W9I0_9ACTN|nr:protein translocase subunit SecD [Actinomadura madurae]SFQ16277.1 preprotein translocase subunit SecD [Actinomadura madurae]SPT57480.1 preprotein translocase subunit SecD [Actinomadura madurae]